MAEYSVVEYHSDHSAYRCGYCGSKDTNYSHGMWAHNMTTLDYQDLIDRGWRRSGKYVYKPTMNKTCCPQYTIRCKVADFRLSDSQKKVIKAVNRFLNYGTRRRTAVSEHDSRDSVEQKPSKSIDAASGVDHRRPAGVADRKVEQLKKQAALKPAVNPGRGADPNKPRCQKAKQRRLEMKQKKLRTGNQPVAASKVEKSHVKSLEERLSDLVENPTHRLEIKLVRSHPRSAEFDARFAESHGIYVRYQTTIHRDPPSKPSITQFTRFLVTSPLEDEEETSAAVADGLGSYHQLYLLDGQIIAVAVLDLLPYCVSSVYFYYDPDYSFLSLGTYSALREVALTRQLSSLDSNIRYYYMGFYIYSCPKMRYKGQYEPSFLLCPETYLWFPIKECEVKLDAHKYSRFAGANKVDRDKVDDISNVLCLYKRQVMPYSMYKSLKPRCGDSDEVAQYASFVGKSCAKRILLYRN